MDDVYNNEHGFDIPTEHIPTEEDTQRLFEGDESIVPVLIKGMTAFVVREIDWFLRQNPGLFRYKEDLISEALLTLTIFLDEVKGNKKYTPSKLLGYAKKKCLNAVNEWCKSTSLPVSVPRGSLFYKNSKVDVYHRELSEDDQCTPRDELFGEVWFDDFMSSLNERDQTIIRMKIDCASDREISRTIKLDEHLVAKRLNELLEMYGGYDD